MSTSKPYPQVGDEWEFKFPGKAKKRKIVGSIGSNHGSKVLFVRWERRNKGRYTGAAVPYLQEHGIRLSTKAERERHFENMVNTQRARLGKMTIKLSGNPAGT